MKSRHITRREFLTRAGLAVGAAALGQAVPESVLRLAGKGGLWLPMPVYASPGVVLDPMNPTASFQIEGTPAFLVPATRAGDPLTINDASVAEFCGLFAASSEAAGAADLVVSFALTSIAPAGADAGARFVINDGQRAAVVAACIFKGGQPGIGLATNGAFTDENTYPIFVPVDWTTRTTLRIRRTAGGDGQLVELNGAPLIPPPTLANVDLRGPTRTTGASFELGCYGVEAQAVASLYSAEGTALKPPVAGQLTFRQLRIRDTDSTDRLRFRADYKLGATTNGIDPTTEQVTIKLSTPAGAFYMKPLTGFDVHGQAPRRHWTLSDAQRAASGIEQLMINEDAPAGSRAPTEGSVVLRDLTTDPAVGIDYSNVTGEIVIGTGPAADRLTAIGTLEEKPVGSGKWRLR